MEKRRRIMLAAAQLGFSNTMFSVVNKIELRMGLEKVLNTLMS